MGAGVTIKPPRTSGSEPRHLPPLPPPREPWWSRLLGWIDSLYGKALPVIGVLMPAVVATVCYRTVLGLEGGTEALATVGSLAALAAYFAFKAAYSADMSAMYVRHLREWLKLEIHFERERRSRRR